MTPIESLQTLRNLKGLNVGGRDPVEVFPPCDPAGITALAGETLQFGILCLVSESPALRSQP
jgi:arginase family enzyme